MLKWNKFVEQQVTAQTFLKLLQRLCTCEPTEKTVPEWPLQGNRYLFWQKEVKEVNAKETKKWAWRKWKMSSACYLPPREIKSPSLGRSWKVWMSARSSQVSPCRNLSLPGCLYNGSAINHHFWRWRVLLQAPRLGHQGNWQTTGFNKCSTFLPWGCCSKIISPSGHPGWKLFHTLSRGSNARPEHNHHNIRI